jgi:hypothetical protein
VWQKRKFKSGELLRVVKFPLMSPGMPFPLTGPDDVTGMPLNAQSIVLYVSLVAKQKIRRSDGTWSFKEQRHYILAGSFLGWIPVGSVILSRDLC